jgi:pimeloyl-ACP methyl ester carboxylesterase
MPTAVLVHGTWHGGWCWNRVRDLLAAQGWTVFTPTLTGLADRSHLATRDVDLETHVQDVAGVLDYEDLTDVVLLGHSGGGMIVNGVADRMPQRIGHLIYLDALVPSDGQTVFDVIGGDDVPALIRALAAEKGDGWLIPAEVFSAQDFGVTNPADAAWLESRFTPHPLRVFETPAKVTGRVAEVPRTTYVNCEGFPLDFGPRIAAQFTASGTADTQHWPTGHNVFVTEPKRVVELIISEA